MLAALAFKEQFKLTDMNVINPGNRWRLNSIHLYPF